MPSQPTCVADGNVPVYAYPDGNCPPGSVPISLPPIVDNPPVPIMPAPQEAGMSWSTILIIGAVAWYLLKGK